MPAAASPALFRPSISRIRRSLFRRLPFISILPPAARLSGERAEKRRRSGLVAARPYTGGTAPFTGTVRDNPAGGAEEFPYPPGKGLGKPGAAGVFVVDKEYGNAEMGIPHPFRHAQIAGIAEQEYGRDKLGQGPGPAQHRTGIFRVKTGKRPSAGRFGAETQGQGTGW